MRAALLAAALAATPAAAGDLGPSSRAAAPVTFKTADGWTIAAKWRPAREGRAVVVLGHGYASAGGEWDRLAERLAKEGVGTLCLDLRGHGGSQEGPSGRRTYEQFDRFNGEWASAVEDFLAAARWLEDKHHVKPGLVAFGGASLGANLAARAAKVRPPRFLLLLSAGPGALDAAPAFPTLSVASKKDEAAWSAVMYLRQTGWGETLEAPAGHGVQMFEHPATLERIASWVVERAAPARRPPASRRRS